MIIDREKFLTALLATTIATAALGCGSEPPPPPAAEAPEETVGAEAPPAEPPPAAVEAAAPVAEPVPEVRQVGPTLE